MAEFPTTDQLLMIRSDLADKVPKGSTLDDWMTQALDIVKMHLQDIRGYEWAMLYANGAYLNDSDGNANNQTRCHYLIMYKTAELIYADYAISLADGATWWTLSQHYGELYSALLNTGKFDVDFDEDGSVDETEEKESGTRFLSI